MNIEELLFSRFCPACEALLNFDTLNDQIQCQDCDTQIPFEQIARIKTRISKKLSSKKQDWVEDDSGAAKLPIAEHECEKCGFGQCYYYNRQMRSADEGETTFYQCMRCDYLTSTNN